MGFRLFKKRFLMCRSIDVHKRKDIMMIESFLIADIAGRMQRARLLQRTRRDRIKDEDAFYNTVASSPLVRFAAWLTEPRNRGAGHTKVQPGRNECKYQAACLTRP
ncbi:hypothetical protein FHT82_001843 [Rhizobium sp. BK275]|uniref:hypothetical protein n=1 Tax=unclassified Rhizobium TaxID=2613769 RepID=UPI001801E8AD|nr:MULTISPECIES: hypothetical protein [unclassified Rhizobium]MBB3389120.1 hypothetical protein [Rhizobium sp. BK275]MBB3408476.1 hypothetical protein [Rhizobium sp. BK316]